jgi:AraC family transcriptional regulator
MLLLGHGEFLGREITRRSAPGFIVTFRRSGSGQIDAKPHCHSTPHLLLPLDRGYWSEADGFDESHPSQLIYTPADTCHRDSMVHFGGRYLSISVDAPIIESTVPRLSHPVALSRPIAARVAHCVAWRTVKRDLTDLFLEEACLTLVGELHRSERSRDYACPPWLRQVIEIVHGRGDSLPSISTIGEMIGIHPVHITRVFRLRYGIPLSKYILSIRVQHAMAALRSGKTTVGMVAANNGFTDQSHLCKSFKAILGITPSGYQALFRVAIAPAEAPPTVETPKLSQAPSEWRRRMQSVRKAAPPH